MVNCSVIIRSIESNLFSGSVPLGGFAIEIG